MCVSVNRALRIRSCRPVCLSLFFHLATESANPFSNSSETLVRLSLPRLACSLNTRHTTYYNTVSPFPLAVHGCKATWYRRLPRFVTPRNLFPHTVNFCPVTKELPAFSPAFRLVPHASGFLLDVPLPSFRFPLCPPEPQVPANGPSGWRTRKRSIRVALIPAPSAEIRSSVQKHPVFRSSSCGLFPRHTAHIRAPAFSFNSAIPLPRQARVHFEFCVFPISVFRVMV